MKTFNATANKDPMMAKFDELIQLCEDSPSMMGSSLTFGLGAIDVRDNFEGMRVELCDIRDKVWVLIDKKERAEKRLKELEHMLEKALELAKEADKGGRNAKC